MNGPVLSGGVIVLVAALLWMLYLLPSWRGRHQYNAAERNAVRLNQALRVLAETSETPEEVRLELNARTALAQQRLAKRVQNERENAELARLREELAATRNDPVLRQARARRRTRQGALVVLLLGIGMAGLGGWQLATAGGFGWLIAGGVTILTGIVVLVQMARVAFRTRRRVAAPAAEHVRVSPPLHDQGAPTWTPRPVPQSLSQVAGSRTQVAQAQREAQEELRRAARREELRRRAEEIAPPEPVRLPAADGTSPYARMGFVDDAEIEAHVRQLLERRAAG
ncbi:hypothetical protein DY023_08665 [Microbacterium bovistercoris]|uniref:Large exoprotein n=1 Tax=Microbacterium bovistercoris TaxID=2293570 RepID=A0A371NW04_9MICO|nr:hypothetical protein [Microbacterium bovistercoris]REJ05990.1 hypothetical protein DY023_08665 [Microbacterium bovistercoris]